ncbi:UDP-2,3-diacylglucosamine diphosphatase [Paenimyroides baculatum]|uniref:UDP-2,3-diacylglucosamine diphosphatase n=1 Tax=Paenimyroides baculatum TaxID=2608000 RepID=A0A5M6CFN8_9FLAO|nr:UDP-2,3-diacylglucosamine diphosphatase [Paenimyroides baculatum]KAA5531929.1 UDP-2,3-diacylglucosamine diphosphatase [Paenimyroides baculatum]
MITLEIPADKKVYFTSDHHFGAPTREKSLPREALFLKWLNAIEKDAGALFIVGDLFDFWFEYKKVVPKGFVRILGKLAQMRDNGLPIYFFVGNHDLWMEDYFEEELDIPVFHEPKVFKIFDKTVFIGHGDGLGPGDKGYKRMKKVFTNPFSKWLFRWLHPDIGVRLAEYLSVKNKLISGDDDAKYLGEEKEWLILYANKKVNEHFADYFIFGHRHLPMTLPLKNNANALYINLGDWIQYFTFGVLTSSGFELNSFSQAELSDSFLPKPNHGV